MNKTPIIYVVSDSVGETAEQVTKLPSANSNIWMFHLKDFLM
ncbi:ATP/GTP-binding protein [Mesobacillus boroniphilus JCM 21738]|uniref:ATP/GTP-binding protein n=1 Tax=Mesobacillus boroniphilus JCM 21738 TaxID=1294265 RepID=W4RRE3_9BACI|nr:ATP/GTP-binding protein [Mesobacillus boroniphilus JCM 21738]